MPQNIESKESALMDKSCLRDKNHWQKPINSWLKCSIGHSWDKKSGTVVSAWVLRNREDIVLLHSRKSSVECRNEMDPKLMSWSWAIESMSSLKIPRDIFAGQEIDLVGMIERPKYWTSFRFYSSSLLQLLEKVLNWRLLVLKKSCNKGAFLIARSVTKEDRRHARLKVALDCKKTFSFE